MIKDIAFVGYPVTDMARSRNFYESVLGLVANSEFSEGQWIEYSVGQGTLALGCMDGWKPSGDGPSIALEVDDFDGTISMLKENSVVFTMEPHTFPTCSMVIIADPDGNQIVIHKKKA